MLARDDVGGHARHAHAARGGVAVDEAGRSSDPDVFAAGDCASLPYEGRRIRLESVQNAIDQAEVAAAAMLGLPYAFKIAGLLEGTLIMVLVAYLSVRAMLMLIDCKYLVRERQMGVGPGRRRVASSVNASGAEYQALRNSPSWPLAGRSRQ